MVMTFTAFSVRHTKPLQGSHNTKRAAGNADDPS